MHDAPTETGRPRPADVDSLWVLALLLLIANHVLFVYSARESWLVVSSHNGYWADYILGLLQSWYLPLMFFVGGVAVRYMLERDTFAGFVANRAARLLVPFLFAIVVLVPPMRFVRLDSHGQSYLEYLTQEAAFVTPYLGLRLPEFENAWILPFLFVYAVLAGLFWRFAPAVFQKCQGAIEKLPLSVPIFIMMVWFAFMALVVFPLIPPSGMVLTDISGHMKFAPAFLLGALIGQSDVFRSKLGAIKTPLWLATLALSLISVALEWLLLSGRMAEPSAWHLVRGALGGAMLFSIVAFGQWALNRQSPALAYASDAIMPVYLMHQVSLIVAADSIVGLRWPLVFEFAALLAATILAPLVAYHVLVRHVPPTRALFGLAAKRST